MALTQTQQEQLTKGLETAKQQALGIQSKTKNLSSSQSQGVEQTINEQILKRINASSGSTSSAQTGVSDLLNKAQESFQSAQESSGANITSKFDRLIADEKKLSSRDLTSAKEAQRGFASNNALLQQIKTEGKKRVADLETRRQEALASNNTQFATQLGNLQLQSIKFEMEAEQNTFNRLLQIGQFGVGLKQLQLQISQESRLKTSSELSNELAQDRFDFLKLTTAEDQRQSQVSINLRSRELKLKELNSGAGLKAGPGFANVSIESDAGVAVNSSFAFIDAKVLGRERSGQAVSQEEQEGFLIEEYLKLRREYSQSEVEDFALQDLFGLSTNESGELFNLAGSQADQTELPGEGIGFLNLLGQGLFGLPQTSNELKRLNRRIGSDNPLSNTERQRRDELMRQFGRFK